jgi:hypothetical protein
LWLEGATEILKLSGNQREVKTKSDALRIGRGLFQWLLDSDQYLHAAALQWGPDVFQTEPESTRRVFAALHEGAMILLMGASSASKCLGPDVQVMMADGSIKKARDVIVGDRLMGDDGLPRNVLQTDVGNGPMYRIVPERGEPWTCNDQHILTLRQSSGKKCGNSGKPSKKTFKGNVVDMTIGDYIKSSSSRKNILKLFRVGVDFRRRSVEFDPYIYGAWLGDGGTDVPALHTPDGPMAKEWCRYFESKGFRIHVGYRNTSCPMWCARTKDQHVGFTHNNAFLDFIRSSVVGKEKFIRDEYLRNCREIRMGLLAGLIDSDGCAHRSGYGFVSKFENLARQVQWLARSLGFAATLYPRIHTIKSIGFSGTYWHISISGKGITEIPTLEKHAKEHTGNKNLLNHGFTVEPIGNGNYYGFVIDGNRRFLLGDFTVTHNTYAAGGFYLLDYLRDPLYTTVKLAAVNEDHLKKNLFAHVSNLFRSCVIPPPYDIQVQDSALWMGIKAAGYEFGISGIAFKQSQDTSGQFKGYKAKPVRRKPHQRFGVMSRLRVLGDEGQNWPGGPFKDFNSLVASISGSDLIKIAVAFNPEDTSRHVVQIAEPPDGWDLDDLDRLYDYVSKAGWRVCRLDAALIENVKQRKIIYPGLQTYEGYMSYLKAGGDSSANYMCFARGFPPLRGSVWTVIPPTWPQQCRGEAIFVENPTMYGAVDLAFMGQDSAQMVVGRWGLASGWRDYQHQNHDFLDRLDITKKRPRHVLQIDQILPLQKSDNTVVMSEEIIGRCKMLHINPDNLAVDATGYGYGVSGHLKKVFGDVFGISWNEKATERKILAEDQEGADTQVEGVMSEMWWAFRRWMDPTCSGIFLNPIIPTNPIHTQLTSRRYKNGKNGIKVESKEEYKGRNQSSPDEADALVMLVHAVRRNSDVLPGIVEQTAPKRERKQEGMNWVAVKDMIATDVSDSIEDDRKTRHDDALVQ